MSRMSILVLAALAALWLAVGDIRRALPPKLVVIQAGPRGGSFETYARRYADFLESRGLPAAVRNQDDSLKIIDKLADPRSGVQVGFTAQRIDSQAYPGLASAGVVELQPLFLFLRRDAAEVRTLADLAGRRLVMPIEGSATAQAAQELLARYGVTRRNTRFAFLNMGEAAAALQRGDHDAGFFMLASGNPLVRRLAADPKLALFSFDDRMGIARNIDYLKPATLARGAFDLQSMLPPHDVAMVGANVNVIVRDDVHPAVLYALLHAMAEVHKGQTLVSDPGEYPRQAGSALPVHALAQEWAKSGTPWLYAHLPPEFAGVMDACWGPALALLAIVSAFGTLQSLNGFIDGVVLALALQLLGVLHRRAARGARPGRLSRLLFRLLEPVVLRQDKGQSARALLETLRPRIPAR
jgi:TRAP-type uncharacterized transport system substrate-binding protein